MVEKYGYNKKFYNNNKIREEKMKTREWSNLNSLQKYPFWTYIKKFNTFTF